MAKGKKRAHREARRLKRKPAPDLFQVPDEAVPSPEECIECQRFPHASWCGLVDEPAYAPDESLDRVERSAPQARF